MPNVTESDTVCGDTVGLSAESRAESRGQRRIANTASSTCSPRLSNGTAGISVHLRSRA